ncbi:hypothetical protein BG011_003647 [Mortierella polycephala]|uniref:Uncharacterized protein n=1 Tax=Mortierella polycephala TaxID=41804 RepID=A0A9P6QGW9_9FUNG|nr:hypothetical protein BG011_003647 [Mortierella polycephala]
MHASDLGTTSLQASSTRRYTNFKEEDAEQEPFCTQEHGLKTVSHQRESTASSIPSSASSLPNSLSEDDQTLISKLLAKAESPLDLARSPKQLVILFSDTFCPILKYHAELISEIIRVVPEVLEAGNATPGASTDSHDGQATPSHPHVMAVILSPKSDEHIREMLAEPFQLDLFDRKRLIDIQIANSPLPIRRLLILDDAWARMHSRVRELDIRSGTGDAKMHCVQSLKQECDRLENILAYISTIYGAGTGPMELLCVLDQSEAELYGVPEGIQGKVIFIVTKDRQEHPKTVALKTCMHWVDRLFQRSCYSLDWIHSNVIPLYVQLPDGPGLDLSGQRQESKYKGRGISLSSHRPLEALTRVKVKQGQGAEVLEPSVLEDIERTKTFEMVAIRKPMFLHLMRSMSLDQDIRVGGGGSEQGSSADKGDIADYTDVNPFL